MIAQSWPKTAKLVQKIGIILKTGRVGRKRFAYLESAHQVLSETATFVSVTESCCTV
jgi:hypothetical protein